MSRNYICERHDYAIKILERVRSSISKALKYDKDNAEELADLLDYIDSDLYDVIDEVNEAKEMGIRMETRLCKYRDVIEDLGFKREG